MRLNNVSVEFDNMQWRMQNEFDGKAWEEKSKRVGLYPDYVKKKWLEIAMQKGVVIIETLDNGKQVFRFIEKK